MRRIFIIIIACIAVVSLAAYFFLRAGRSGDTSTPADSISLPADSGTSQVFPILVAIPTSTTIVFGTAHGSIEVHNFYKDAIGQEETTLLLQNTKDYRITYDTSASSFWLVAVSQPTSVSQKLAEEAFIALLQTTKEIACYLNVSISLVDQRTGLPGPAMPLKVCKGLISS